MSKRSEVDKAIEEAQSLLNILRNLVDVGLKKGAYSEMSKLDCDIAELDRRISRLEDADRAYKSTMAQLVPDEWKAMVTNDPPSMMQ